MLSSLSMCYQYPSRSPFLDSASSCVCDWTQHIELLAVADHIVMNVYEIEASVQPLLSAITSNSPSSPPKLSWFRRQHVIPTSKGVLMILLWNVVVGATFGVIITTGIAVALKNLATNHGHTTNLYYLLAFYASIALIQFLFYPLGGLIADNCCGRHKIVALSIFQICCGYGIVLAPIIIFAENDYDTDSPAVITAIAIAIILFMFGFTGFQANVVQFGLDQLLDSPSEDLSTFLHWFVWTDYVGNLIIRILALLTPCTTLYGKVIAYFPAVFLTVLTASLILSLCKRKWFHCEPRTHSPYGMVYRVLKFTAQHSQPLARRSAFAYCDDEIPSRLDFSKQRYGGPFSTETVEDVKTFLRILVMLVAMGSTYAVHVAVLYMFPLYGIYTGPQKSLFKEKPHYISCNYEDWLILESGNLAYIIPVVVLPLYILFFLPCARKWFPKILFRLGVGMGLTLLAAVTMTLTLVGAHVHQKDSLRGSLCLFNFTYYQEPGTNVDLPVWVLVFPNMLNGIGIPLTFITVLEFISAQSPHAMKGLLLGVFYAVRGMFIVIGCALVFPFANTLWHSREGQLFDCGLSYYTFSVVLGAVGLVVFSLTARWYQYRQREDRPYDHAYVENYYQRYMRTESAPPSTVNSPDEKLLGNTSILDYGTMVGT